MELRKLGRHDLIIDGPSEETKEKRKKAAIEKGEVVRYLKDLKCEHHPSAKFIKTYEINHSLLVSSLVKGKMRRRALSCYICKECQREGKQGIRKVNQMSIAYQCHYCGVVKGGYSSIPYESSQESWRNLAGRRGNHYYCRICGSWIGYYYYLLSYA